MSEERKELITMFVIFFVFISVINVIFNYHTYQKNIKQGFLIIGFPEVEVVRLKKWTIIYNAILWVDIVLYVIMALILKNSAGIGIGLSVSLIYILVMELILSHTIKKIGKYILGKNKADKD